MPLLQKYNVRVVKSRAFTNEQIQRLLADTCFIAYFDRHLLNTIGLLSLNKKERFLKTRLMRGKITKIIGFVPEACHDSILKKLVGIRCLALKNILESVYFKQIRWGYE